MVSCFGIQPKRELPKPRVNFHLLPVFVQFSIMSKLSPKDFINLAQTCSDLRNKCHEIKQKPFVEISRININKEGIFARNKFLYPWEIVMKSCWPISAKLLLIEVNGFEDLLPMLNGLLLGIRHVDFYRPVTVNDCSTVRKFLKEMNVRMVTSSKVFPHSEVLNKSIMVRVRHALIDSSEFLAMDCSIAILNDCVLSHEAVISKIKTWMTEPFSGSALNLVFEYEIGKGIQKIPEILGAVQCEGSEPMLSFDSLGDDLICDRKFYKIELDKGYRLMIILRFFNSWRLGFVCVLQGPEST